MPAYTATGGKREHKESPRTKEKQEGTSSQVAGEDYALPCLLNRGQVDTYVSAVLHAFMWELSRLSTKKEEN